MSLFQPNPFLTNQRPSGNWLWRWFKGIKLISQGWGIRHLVLILLLSGSGCTNKQHAQSASIALHGAVLSSEEGPMEGVVVMLRAVDETILTAVTSDALGQYQFQRDRVTSGRYVISVRAAGYQMSVSDAPQIVVIEDNNSARHDLSLTAVIDPLRLASQLTSLDWIKSFPGSEAQKIYWSAIWSTVVSAIHLKGWRGQAIRLNNFSLLFSA